MKLSEQCEKIYNEIQEHLQAIKELQEKLDTIDFEALDNEEDEFWDSNTIREISSNIDRGLYEMNYA